MALFLQRTLVKLRPRMLTVRPIHTGTHICPKKFHRITRRLRNFFDRKGFIEVHSQNRLSILAACEDPFTIASFNYAGKLWPLPQTGQMWLEHELLKNPSLPGLYSIGTSYRNEPNPVPGRHDLIFPMFEFEMHGGVDALLNMEADLCVNLGFQPLRNINKKVTTIRHGFPSGKYLEMARRYNVNELDHCHELKMKDEFGPVFMLTHFPDYTSPFWNMAREEDSDRLSKKVDVIINGVETIGSAERSCNKEKMRHEFYTISEGAYAKTLFDRFGKDRVESELNEFLSFDFFPRSGGGIGITRLIKAIEENDRNLACNLK